MRPKALWVALIIAILAAVLAPVATAEAEGSPCPNEQLRSESSTNPDTGQPYSAQLPDCRAYELVSPGNAAGAVLPRALSATANSGLGFTLETAGNLYSQLNSAVDVEANGEVVLWESEAAVSGTGAVQDGQSINTFRSVRTPSGWKTEDLTSFRDANGNQEHKFLVGASEDGSTALIATPLALTPAAFADPQQALGDPSITSYLYRVFADGRPPQIVTAGDQLIPEKSALPRAEDGGGAFHGMAASADLSEVAFMSSFAFDPSDNCISNASQQSAYLWNAASGLARPIVNFNGGACAAPNVSEVLAVLPDGRTVLQPNAANPLGGHVVGPLVENIPAIFVPGSLTPLSGPSGATLLSVSPDGLTAYVESTEALSAGATGTDIYSVSTTAPQQGEEGSLHGVVCISCSTDQTSVTYLATSKDGTHVVFTTDQGLWEWDAASGAQLLTPTPVTDLGPHSVVVSENGCCVVGLTSQLSNNPNGTADLYEFRAGRLPVLVTSGSSADSYSLYTGTEVSHPSGGVSNDGSTIVYDNSPANGGPAVIDEWTSGQTDQISPVGSHNAYDVAAISGGELQDVFFLASDPLVPEDANGGAIDVYDTRIGSGFPNPKPAANENQTANPTPPTTTPYTGNLAPSSFNLPALGADTSIYLSAVKPKASTRVHRLAKADKACKRDHSKSKRKACERSAQRKYARKQDSEGLMNRTEKRSS